MTTKKTKVVKLSPKAKKFVQKVVKAEETVKKTGKRIIAGAKKHRTLSTAVATGVAGLTVGLLWN
jgi:hypothetical protein